MTKSKLLYCCQACGAVYPKWMGQCNSCEAWNTIVEEIRAPITQQKRGYAGAQSSITPLIQVPLQEENRLPSGSAELDRVLGGGLVAGSAILLGGDPGIGKSTLLLQTLAHLSQTQKVLYVSGEESLQQIAMRAKRLNLPHDNLLLLTETTVETIIDHLQKEKPCIAVIDSIQTIYTALLSSAPGSVGQVRESAMRLVNYAKQSQTIIFLIGHVTKEGFLAGPRVLEHMVDTVLYFEGEADSRYRMIRAIKNRYGAVNELGIFAMTEKGLKGVSQPSALFLSGYKTATPGSMITTLKEGSRPILVEVQALVDHNHTGNARRLSLGLDAQRLSMLLAILNKHGGIATHNLDVFINIVGGLRILETAADLSIIFAVISSLRNEPCPTHCIAFGEIGLGGEIRPVTGGQERLKEAAKHGFKKAIIPADNIAKQTIEGITLQPVSRLSEAIALLN